MEYRNLGHSGLKVSTLCLGTMTFGEADAGSFMHNVGCDAATAHDIMANALDAGVNFFDTADVYGPDGLTERVIGEWFETSGCRDEVVLATKCRFRMGDGPLGTGASRRRIVAAVEASLKRLRTDRIDLYQIHMQDIETPEEETLRALDDLVRAGKVLYIGASNYAAYRLVESLWASESRLLERFIALQAQYSLLERSLEREHVPLCLKHGLGIMPWSPLAGGFLSGKYRRDDPPPEDGRLASWNDTYAKFANERGWSVLDTLQQVAEELDVQVAQVALRWLIQRAGVTSVIFGARSVAQLRSNLGADGFQLTDDQMQRLTDASAFEIGYPYQFMQNVQGRW